jgi:hypothetical protein
MKAGALRDPGVEPRSGDTLQASAQVLVLRRTQRWVLFERSGLKLAMRLTQWKRQMRAATIIHVAEG